MASPRRDLTFVERTVMNTLRAMFETTEGYYGAFDEEMIRHRGLGEYLKSLVYLSKHWIRLNKFFGADNTHILAFYSSLWNGCMYCGYGHLYAHNLNYFARTGKLFPLDEQEITTYVRAKDEDLMALVRERLADPEYAQQLRLIERLYYVRMEKLEAGNTQEDELLRLSIPYYSFINECSIVVEEQAPPMGKVAKNKDLIARYQLARAAAKQPPPPGQLPS